MKIVIYIVLGMLIFSLQPLFAQVGINTDNSAPDDAAMLDVKSTDKGILVPRLTTVQRTAIPSPPDGLLVYDITSHSFWFVKSSQWQEITGGGASAIWSTTGNTGTDPDVNFIGTSDNKALNFRVNNIRSGTINSNGTTYFGYQAGRYDDGNTNSGFGTNALGSNNYGWHNTAVGNGALGGNTTGSYNTAVGYYALGWNNGSFNTALGRYALASNQSGESNTAVGHGSLYSNSSGSFNTTLGDQSLNLNSTGNYNTASGYEALARNTIGSNNVAFGRRAGYFNEEGNNNTAIGYMALLDNAYGSGNTFVGYLANPTSDNFSHSTAIGSNVTISGSNSTALGHGAFVEGSNSTAIGNGAQVIGDNTIRLGNESITGLYCSGPFHDTTMTYLPNLMIDSTGRIRRSIISPLTGAGQSDKIAMWNSTSQLGYAGNLFWDNVSHRLGINWVEPHAPLQLPNILGNRQIILYELGNNDHQYYGLGVNSNTLRYQVPSTQDAHVFYAGNGSDASYELMRIQGNGTVGIGNQTPSSSALLDISSTSKGFLLPRMTTAQRDAIAYPATGLMIFNTTTKTVNVFDGIKWTLPDGSEADIPYLDGQPCRGTPVVWYGEKIYNTVKIGSQCWLRENLNIGTLFLGTPSDNGIVEKTCVNYQESNCNIYGGLYDWNEAMQYVTTSGAQGICPPGWHIPSYSDWSNLRTYLGGSSVAGGKMKETGTSHWNSPNTGATNSSGFTSLPGSGKAYNGVMPDVGISSHFWTSSTYIDESYSFWNSYSSQILYESSNFRVSCYSIRCLRD